MAAVQLGKYLGAKVIATGTSEEKLALTKEWGADHTVLTHKNGDVEFRQEVKDLTEGKGADVIYDPVGGDVFGSLHKMYCLGRKDINSWGLLAAGFQIFQ